MSTSIKLTDAVTVTATAATTALAATIAAGVPTGVLTYYIGIYVTGAANVSLLASDSVTAHTAAQLAPGSWDTFGPFRAVDDGYVLYAASSSACAVTIMPVTGEGR